MRAEKTLLYLRTGVGRLLERGTFVNGMEFRPSQRLALEAYREHLNREDLPPEEQLKGFFVLPTGTGKTPLFIAITTEAQEVAREHGDNLRVATVVPTTKVMHQTKAQVEEWGTAVGRADIGMHGDGHRQVGHDFNIYTYDAWVDLTRKGKLGSHNVDILISDEAHRGTSEVRIEEIFSQYENNGTACLAFTATYAFDEDKSVERTHKHKVIERKIKQCVEDRELAAYIAVQFYVIRVMPPMEYPDGVEPADYNRMLMRKALMHRMVATARDGVDGVTQEPLFDDQMGFYCQDTKMADQLAQMLNDDEVMLERMESIGGKGVAVPIHSNIRPKKINVDGKMVRTTDYLLEQMETGFFAGFTGDSQLKEGYDYPHLKVLFDGARGSLVDKAQIIGRAARRLENDMKGGKLEGMTFVDFITYMGDPDPEIDAKNKETARRRAITASKVLGDKAILGPGVEPKPRKIPAEGKLGGAGLPAVIEGQEVEAFTTLEESRVFAAQLQKLHEGEFIEITAEMVAKIEEEQARTGKKAYAIVNSCPELIEKGISVAKIDGLRIGVAGWSLAQLETLLNAYKSQPNLPSIATGAKVSVSESYLLELNKERKRTGLGPTAIIQASPSLLSMGITFKKIAHLDVNTLSWTQEQLDALLTAYKAQPTLTPAELEDRITITESMMQEYEAEKWRTKLGPISILVKNPDLLSHGITESKMSSIVVGSTSWTNSQWIFMLDTFRAQPTINDHIKFFIDGNMISFLKTEIERTGISPTHAFRKCADLETNGISITKIRNLLSSDETNSWSEVQWNALINFYKSQPSKEKNTPLDDVQVDRLNFEIERTGVGQYAIIRIFPELLNIGIDAAKIGRIRPGSLSWSKNQFDTLLSCYAKLPDKPLGQKQGSRNITKQSLDAMEQALNAAQEGPETKEEPEIDDLERG